jgi:homoserine O-acetyltransferase
LTLDCDELLVGPTVAFETYGDRSAPGGAVLLIHGLSRSHLAATGTVEGGKVAYSPDGWFSQVIGDGLPLDPKEYFIVSAGLLGSPWGSSSPLTTNPETGEPYGSRFWPVTISDMARSLSALCTGLKIDRLRGVIGVSLGGMVAMRLASMFPELVGSLAVLGASAALPDQVRRRLAQVRPTLMTDPRSLRRVVARAGELPPPLGMLKKVRLEHLRDVHSAHGLGMGGDLLQQERALEREAASFTELYDARAYVVMSEAFARADLYDFLPKIRSRTLVMASSSDLLAPPERVRDVQHRLMGVGTRVSYVELQSEHGHRAFYREAAVGPALRDFLAQG